MCALTLAISPQTLAVARAAVDRAYLCDEAECLATLLPLARLDRAQQAQVEALARRLVNKVRDTEQMRNGIDALLREYDLSTQEGILLMCLAEALLRIPDDATVDRLIQDKLSTAEWDRHLGRSPSWFVNASTWGLLFTGRLIRPETSSTWFGQLITRCGEPVVRAALRQAMRLVGHQFVMGDTIDEALMRSSTDENRRYHYSFDMLGEMALTAADAKRYFAAYRNAIVTLGEHTQTGGLFDRPGISVKLSALHPRHEYAQRQRVLDELSPHLLELVCAARAANISIVIDAEEAERLDLSLDIFAAVLRDASLTGWEGFGLAVQAYQKRALQVIDWLARLASECGHQIPLRLVKGAYWDSEIKQAQERGLEGYPV